MSLPLILAQAAGLLLNPGALETISRGGVHVQRDWLPPDLLRALRADAEALHATGHFSPDGLTNAAKSRAQQGFSARADRQTFRNDAWDTPGLGDVDARLEFASRMRALRLELARGLERPTLADEGRRKHEMTYNWYEPGAKLGRHLDEHHEETKGTKGWTVPTRRSVTWLVSLNEKWQPTEGGGALGWTVPTRRSITWLVYLNDAWQPNEGGALRTFPRSVPAASPIGAHLGNLQVGWLRGPLPVSPGHGGPLPVFLDAATRDDGLLFLYARDGSGSVNLLSDAFPMPPKPVDFGRFINRAPPGFKNGAQPGVGDAIFEQISTARLDPRFAGGGGDEQTTPPIKTEAAAGQLDILPVGGTLVLFDSVTLPHQVLEVAAQRPRLASTGWFHEDSQLFIPPFPKGQPGA